MRTNFDACPLGLGIYYRKKKGQSPDRPEFHSSFLSEAPQQLSQKLYEVAFTFLYTLHFFQALNFESIQD